MELASMLAAESFSDRPASASRVIAAFLRTYDDGLGDDRRQDLYLPLSSAARSRRLHAAEGRQLASELFRARRNVAHPRLPRAIDESMLGRVAPCVARTICPSCGVIYQRLARAQN